MVQHVLKERYLRKEEQYEDMLFRVAEFVASAEKDAQGWWGNQFFDMMSEDRFLPNSPTLMNAGNDIGQLSACFVLPVPDDMHRIGDTLTDMMVVQKSGGGTGFSFSRLRPKGAAVGSTGKVASGPISFMRLFNAAGGVVKQGSKRPGANMAILSVNHPDIREFIALKMNRAHESLKTAINSTVGEGGWDRVFSVMPPEMQEEYRQRMWEMTNFNVSVGITDEFMVAVRQGTTYALIDPHTNEVARREDANEIFRLICEAAWRTGDPGLFFIDRANHDNPVPHIARIEATNPCGEQPLMPNEPCNLGSVNLSAHVIDGKMDEELLKETTATATRFLDNVIDKNKYPTPQIREMAQGARRIGLGVMGFADALLKMGVDYRSQEALELAKHWGKIFKDAAYETSRALADEKGVYPWYDGRPETYRRNSVVLTIAPTGTISMFARCSSGIEPVFSYSYERRAAGSTFTEYHSLAEPFLANGEVLPSHFCTAFDVEPEHHIHVQAEWQRNIDSAVSKTINLPTEATVEDISKAYLLAYELELKGITVFRDGCKNDLGGQVISATEKCPNCSEQVTLIRKEGCKACPKCAAEFCG